MSELEERGTSIEDPDDEENGEEQEEESGGKGPGIVVKLALIVVVFGGLAFGAYMLTQKVIIPMIGKNETVQAFKERLNQPKEEKEKKVKDRGDPIRHNVDGMVANLSGSRRVVAFDLLLEVYSKDAQKELVDKDFQIRDAMLIYFGARTLQEISTREFLVTVRDTIKTMLNGFLEDAPIDTVYFTKFIFQ